MELGCWGNDVSIAPVDWLLLLLQGITGAMASQSAPDVFVARVPQRTPSRLLAPINTLSGGHCTRITTSSTTGSTDTSSGAKPEHQGLGGVLVEEALEMLL